MEYPQRRITKISSVTLTDSAMIKDKHGRYLRKFIKK